MSLTRIIDQHNLGNYRLPNLPIDQLHPPPSQLWRQNHLTRCGPVHDFQTVMGRDEGQRIHDIGGRVVEGDFALEGFEAFVLFLEATVGL